MPPHAHSTSSDSTARSVHFAQDTQSEGSYSGTDVYARRASQSSYEATHIPSSSSSGIRMTPGHSRDMSGSSMASTSSTTSFFPTLRYSPSAPHTAGHRYNDSGSSMSSLEYPVLEKPKTIDLPQSDESHVASGWETRGSDSTVLHVVEQLQDFVIRPEMAIPLELVRKASATEPFEVTSMLVSFEGLEAFDPILIEATGTYLTAAEVVRGILDYLEAPVTMQERVLLHKQMNARAQLASGIRRYELLSQLEGEKVKVAFQGFSFDATKNEWVLHRSRRSLVK